VNVVSGGAKNGCVVVQMVCFTEVDPGVAPAAAVAASFERRVRPHTPGELARRAARFDGAAAARRLVGGHRTEAAFALAADGAPGSMQRRAGCSSMASGAAREGPRKEVEKE
jgi:hypothetical protein